MTRAEWIEATTILIVAIGSWLVSPHFSSTIPLWQIVLSLSALLLAQSLVRDVTILLRHHSSAVEQPPKEAQCFCLESTVGTTGIVAAIALIGIGSSASVSFQRWQFFLAIAGTLALGFFIKDLVITWNPFGVRREKDHLNLIVRWKRK